MSYLTQAEAAGFPLSLLVPICPPSAPPDRFPDRGKSPAVWGYHGWTNHKDWQSGTSPEVLQAADAQGCNIGVICGKPADDYQFVFIDIDTIGDDLAKQIQTVTLRALADYTISVKLWVRLTRPGRAGVLMMLPAATLAGRVSTAHLSAPDGSYAGAIQVLATGQQAVIGGMHPWHNGTPIEWLLLHREPDKSFRNPFPSFAENAIPLAENREAVNEAIEAILIALQNQLGVTFTYKKRQALNPIDETPLEPEDQAPWDVQAFTNLFNTMPHNAEITRDMWVNTMLAAQGCIEACTAPDKHAMIETAVAWSARWEDPTGLGTTVIDEMEAWEKDWSTRSVHHLGWDYLVNQAITLGNDQLRNEKAAREFPATVEYVEPIAQASPPSIVESVKTTRRGKRIKFDVKTSEIQIADTIEDALKGKCAYIVNEKKWIAWGGPDKAWSDKSAGATVHEEIQNQLIYYVAKHHDEFGDNEQTRAKLTSARCVRDIDTLLKSRMAITSADIDKGELILQTPNGPWDLTTGKPLTGENYDNLIKFYDTRITRASPAEGPTPLFNGLLDHLACGDQATVNWLWAYLGYGILGKSILDIICVVFGPGGNGKSRLAEVLMAIEGDYAVTVSRKVIMKSGDNDHPTALNRLRGKRFWCVSELNPKETWNEAQIRALSGGDKISARNMGENLTDFKPEGTFLIYTNFVPPFHRIDEAIVRRFRMIHGRLKIPEEKIDRTFEETVIKQEGDAILYRLIQEGRKVIERGWQLPNYPAVMKAETTQYFNNQDNFQGWFIEDCTVTRLDSSYAPIAVDLLYERYKAYMNKDKKVTEPMGLLDENMDCMSIGHFLTALRRMGVSFHDLNGKNYPSIGGRTYVGGVRLKALAEIAA